jgi:transcriptional regulator with XRE-family HTH domain
MALAANAAAGEGGDNCRMSDAAHDRRAMGDVRIGRAARALRHRLRLRQLDVAARSDVGRDVISRLERGRLDGMTVGRLRRVFACFDAEVVLIVRWRGGEIDRLLDRRHAELGGRFMTRLDPSGWAAQPETSFSSYGERGAIDALAWNPATRTLLVVEVKTELTSIEETLRRHDVKVRLAPSIARERFGWDVIAVARVLVLPDDRTIRRQVERHDAILRRAYPLRGIELNRWLQAPSGPASGLLFLSIDDGVGTRQRLAPTWRVRRPRAS